MAPHIRELVTAVVRRMQSSDIAGLKSSLIVVLARLVSSFTKFHLVHSSFLLFGLDKFSSFICISLFCL